MGEAYQSEKYVKPEFDPTNKSLDNIILYAKSDSEITARSILKKIDKMNLPFSRIPKPIIIYGYCPKFGQVASRIYLPENGKSARSVFEEQKRELLDVFEGYMIIIDLEQGFETYADRINLMSLSLQKGTPDLYEVLTHDLLRNS